MPGPLKISVPADPRELLTPVPMEVTMRLPLSTWVLPL